VKKSRISRRSFFHQSSAFLLSLWASQSLAQPWASGMRLSLEFSYVGGGGRYRAPYIAAWVENAQGLDVRELALWYLQDRKGPRWLNELRRWYSRSSLDAASSVSGPTRMPGRYTLVWDGKNSQGEALPQGEYFICIEYSREHGPYELFREKLSFASSAFNKTYTPGRELQEVRLAYK
jgi:hypothetical protein